MPATIYLVRHGETDDNVSGVPQGLRDVPLNALGRAQADAVARWFDGRTLDAVVSSPLSRTLDVARAIAARCQTELETDARLVEFDQGDLDGLPIAEVRERYPEFIARWRDEDPADLRMPGGETYGEVQARIVAAIEDASSLHAAESVAIVSHNLAIKSALCHALGVPLAAFRRIRVDLASVSMLEVDPGRWWRVSLLNERCHVADEGAVWESVGR
jgi:broad specificity phosphatase PhoE